MDDVLFEWVPYAMEIYCGRNEKDDRTPLGIRVVSNMVSVLEAPEHHEVYFDNFFTSHGLLTKLADKGFERQGLCEIQEPVVVH
ncbi:hypothetical protein MRX96_042153 [Rhipicephalus microplus]